MLNMPLAVMIKKVVSSQSVSFSCFPLFLSLGTSGCDD